MSFLCEPFYGIAGRFSALVFFQFYPGVYARRRRSTILARLVSPIWDLQRTQKNLPEDQATGSDRLDVE
jgi:hypothetical protein